MSSNVAHRPAHPTSWQALDAARALTWRHRACEAHQDLVSSRPLIPTSRSQWPSPTLEDDEASEVWARRDSGPGILARREPSPGLTTRPCQPMLAWAKGRLGEPSVCSQQPCLHRRFCREGVWDLPRGTGEHTLSHPTGQGEKGGLGATLVCLSEFGSAPVAINRQARQWEGSGCRMGAPGAVLWPFHRC